MFFALLTIFVLVNRSSSSASRLIDLTHTIKPATPNFPTQTRFDFINRTATWVRNEKSFFYSSNSFMTSEHMGTHIDAPYHFFIDGWKVDQIPLDYLMSIHARVIDVSKQCENNSNYLITVDDVKKNHVNIPEINEQTGEPFRFVLLFNTGWAKYWSDEKAYAGNKTHLTFPGVSEQLATYLVETYKTQLVGVGIDTLSLDHGPSKDFVVHQILAKNHKYGLENVAALDEVLRRVGKEFFLFDVVPMKIGDGTGAPCRLFAHLTTGERTSKQLSSSSTILSSFSIVSIFFSLGIFYLA